VNPKEKLNEYRHLLFLRHGELFARRTGGAAAPSRIPAVPIVRLLAQKTIRTTTETVGLVFPNFCMTMPFPVHDFLKKVDLASADYLFAICTRGGTSSEAFSYANQILKRAGQQQRIDAQIDITMPWNHPLGENLPAEATEERIVQLEAEMQEKLDLFSQHVRAREPYIVPDTDADFEVPGWA
jgi:hypothetical protein